MDAQNLFTPHHVLLIHDYLLTINAYILTLSE